MSLPHISAVALLPRGIPSFCAASRHWPKRVDADVHLVAPDGVAVGHYCQACADACIAEYSEKLGEPWTAEPIFHDGDDRRLVSRHA